MTVDEQMVSLVFTPEGMAAALEAKLSAAVFEEKICGRVYQWALDYQAQYRQAPPRSELEREFPKVEREYPAPEEISLPVERVIEWLQHRYVVNQVQDVIRSVLTGLSETRTRWPGRWPPTAPRLSRMPDRSALLPVGSQSIWSRTCVVRWSCRSRRWGWSAATGRR